MQTKYKHANTCQRASFCKYISANKYGINIVKHLQSRHFDPNALFHKEKSGYQFT